jgi:hypothetical protein
VIVAPGFVFLVGEILDRLVIEEGIDGLGVGLGVHVVHLPAVCRAPLGDGESVADVKHQRAHGDNGEPVIELVEQQA